MECDPHTCGACGAGLKTMFRTCGACVTHGGLPYRHVTQNGISVTITQVGITLVNTIRCCILSIYIISTYIYISYIIIMYININQRDQLYVETKHEK